MKSLWKFSRILMAARLICGAAAYAKADVIDFSGFNPGSLGAGNSYQVGAFTVTASTGPVIHPTDIATIYSDGGVHAAGDGGLDDVYGTLLDITRTDGGTFTANSMGAAKSAAAASLSLPSAVQEFEWK